MPKLGLTMIEGVLTEWHVKVGSNIQTGDLLFSVETDKIVTDIEARAAGEIIDLIVAEGETVPVGSVVAAWTGPTASFEYEMENDGEGDEQNAVNQPPADQQEDTSTSAGVVRIVASPAARRLARQNHIDLESLEGSGPNGKVKLADVEEAMGNNDTGTPQIDRADAIEVASTRPATRFEKIVAQRLLDAKLTIPHFYLHAHADVTELLALRERQKRDLAVKQRFSLTDFVIFALGRAVAKMPELNAIWDDQTVISLPSVDIGMAVDTKRGLFVPVVRDIGSVDIHAISQQTRDLATRAKSGELSAEEMEGGAITVSNVGMFGSVTLLPIINPGQSAILGVGGPESVFRPDAEGAPELRTELPLAFACDHRIYDGVRATKLMHSLCNHLANPSKLLTGQILQEN